MPRTPAKTAQATKEIGWTPDFSMFGTPGALIPELVGRSLILDLWKMQATDETVGAILWCIASTLQQVEWKHVPQLDGVDNDADEESVRLAGWSDGLLVDMSHSMADLVDDAINMIWAGFAPCEIVLKQRTGGDESRFNDRFYGIAKMPLRDPVTIWDWEYDAAQQNVVALRQNSWQGSATIPMWKVCNFRTINAIDQPMGRPLMRNAHRVWRLKLRIQDSEAIGIERDLCGLPTFRVPEQLLTEAAEKDDTGQPTEVALKAQARIQTAIKAVKDMRFNQSGGLVMPSDTFFEDTAADTATGAGDRTPKYDFKLVTTAGSRTIDTRTAARDYDRAIARVAMMQFLHLGDRSTGSYSLSDDQSSMAVKSLMAIAKKIATEFTRKALKLVWTVNNFDMRRMPRLAPSEVSKEGAQQIGALLNGIGRSVDLWSSDAEARIALLRMAGVKVNRTAQVEAAQRAGEQAENEAEAAANGLGAGTASGSAAADDGDE